MKRKNQKVKRAGDLKLTKAQELELKRDGMVIVGDRIIRTASYIRRVEEGAKKEIAKEARNVLG